MILYKILLILIIDKIMKIVIKLEIDRKIIYNEEFKSMVKTKTFLLTLRIQR